MWIILGHQSIIRFQGWKLQHDMYLFLNPATFLQLFDGPQWATLSCSSSFFQFSLRLFYSPIPRSISAVAMAPLESVAIWRQWPFSSDWRSDCIPSQPTVVLNNFVSNQIFFVSEFPMKIRITLLEIWHYFFWRSHGKLEEVRKSWKQSWSTV